MRYFVSLEIFLFNETAVIFLAGSGTGKGDAAGIAPGKEGAADKL
jgi:hypothetical protein